jgi:hypothetical protein
VQKVVYRKELVHGNEIKNLEKWSILATVLQNISRSFIGCGYTSNYRAVSEASVISSFDSISYIFGWKFTHAIVNGYTAQLPDLDLNSNYCRAPKGVE